MTYVTVTGVTKLLTPATLSHILIVTGVTDFMTTDNTVRPHPSFYLGERIVQMLASLLQDERLRTGYKVPASQFIRMLIENEFERRKINPQPKGELS
jgi:hypothetical protein